MWLILIILLALATGPIGWIFLGAIVIIALYVSKNGDEYIMKINKERNTNHDLIMSGKILGFVPTKYIKNNILDYGVYIDSENMMIVFTKLSYVEARPLLLRFDELIECSIVEDGATLLSGSVGNAVVGGIIGGTTGAIIGDSSRNSEPVALSVSIRIITSNIQHPIHQIPIIQKETIRTSDEYKNKMEFAQEVYATLISAMNIAKKSEVK